MSFPLHFRSGGRAALWATLALWGLTFCIFLLTAVTGRNGLQLWHVPFYFSDVLAGLAASGPLYLLVRRSDGLPVGRRTGLLGLGTVLAATAVSFVDGWLYLQFQPRFEPNVPSPPLAGLIGFNLLIYVWIFGFYTAVQVLIAPARRCGGGNASWRRRAPRHTRPSSLP